MVSTVFPSVNMRILSSLIHFFGVSVCAFCFSRRTSQEDFLSFRGLTSITWPRWCVILVFLDSWVFLLFTGVLINGFGLSVSTAACSVGIYACIFFYALSKVMIYAFLVEKVFIVWRSSSSVSRFSSRVYLTCLAVMTGYIAILILMIIGKIAYLRQDGACIIGLESLASIPLLAYDLFVNLFLTSLFLWPLFRSSLTHSRLRRVALRTLGAALAALITSAVNIAILTIMHGRQLGWVCLGSCGTDVTLNAIVLYWVTGGGRPSGNGGGSSGPVVAQPPLSIAETTAHKTSMAVGADDAHHHERGRRVSRAIGGGGFLNWLLGSPPPPSHMHVTVTTVTEQRSDGQGKCSDRISEEVTPDDAVEIELCALDSPDSLEHVGREKSIGFAV